MIYFSASKDSPPVWTINDPLDLFEFCHVNGEVFDWYEKSREEALKTTRTALSHFREDFKDYPSILVFIDTGNYYRGMVMDSGFDTDTALGKMLDYAEAAHTSDNPRHWIGRVAECEFKLRGSSSLEEYLAS